MADFAVDVELFLDFATQVGVDLAIRVGVDLVLFRDVALLVFINFEIWECLVFDGFIVP